MTTPRKNKKLTSLQIKLGALVDDPAQEHAKILMVKGAAGEGVAKAYVPDDECTALITDETDGHQHVLYIADDAVGGETSYNGGDKDSMHSHPWILGDDGTIMIAASLSHTHTATMPATAADPLIAAVTETLAEAAATVAEAIAEAASPAEPATVTASAPVGKSPKVDNPESATYNNHKEIPNTMSQPNTITITETEIAKLRAERDAAVALSKLSDAEKAHASTLPEDERPAFITKGRADRAAEMKAAADADPVAYECADGTVIRKSAGPVVAAQAKRIDELTKSEAISVSKARELEIMKRVAVEVPLLKGTDAVKAAILEAVDGIAHAETRAAAIETLKACNGALALLHKSAGHNITTADAAGSARAELRKYVAEQAAKAGADYSVTLAKLSGSDPTCRDLLEQVAQEDAARN